MRYDTEQMMFVGTAVTTEDTAALALHYEIMAAAQTAAASLLDLARKIKRMRDTSGYKALGFDSLEAYTMATMGMKQRQAYNYIAIAEKLPEQLIEQNAAAGVTKLALLAQLSGQEQQQIAAETNLADTTVAELKAQIKELQAKNAGYAEQLWRRPRPPDSSSTKLCLRRTLPRSSSCTPTKRPRIFVTLAMSLWP